MDNSAGLTVSGPDPAAPTAPGAGSQLDDLMRNARRASDFLKALSHENRLLLLCLVAEKERSVSELEELLHMRQAAVSQQLARLRLDGLVTTRRDGKQVYYSLSNPDIRRVIGVLHDVFC